MRRALVVFALVFSSCSAAKGPSPTHAPTTTPAPTATLAAAPTPTPSPTSASNVRYVAVSVATVWALPTSPRAIDAKAISNPADPRGWLASLSDAQKLDLVGRVQTQALYGERVTVTETSGAWSHIVVPSQRSQKDARGYPGWVPTAQLANAPPASRAMVRITSPTLRVRGVELSYGTLVPAYQSPSVSSAKASDVLSEARKFLGLPYMWGGTSGFGFDCSGFTYLVYRAAGISLARDTDQQIKNGTPVALRDVAPGDLLFVAGSHGAIVHEAIYYGDGKIIESPRTGLPVRIVPLSTHSYVAARRVLPQ